MKESIRRQVEDSHIDFTGTFGQFQTQIDSVKEEILKEHEAILRQKLDMDQFYAKLDLSNHRIEVFQKTIENFDKEKLDTTHFAKTIVRE